MKEIKSSQILPFLKYLQQYHEVYVPVKKENNWVYDKLAPEAETVMLKPVMTILPPKKFLIPSDEEIFCNKKNTENCNMDIKSKVIFNVNSFDINALLILDQIMSRPYRDPYYWNKRKKTIIIGLGPERINIANKGFDIFLEEYNDSFLAIPGSQKGHHLLKLNCFKTCNKKPKKILVFKDPILSQHDKIMDKIKKNYGGKIWEELVKTCFGCGICAYVCPLCYCYEQEDNFYINKTCDNCRTRQWDACFLPNFFKVAGHNFRKKLSERIYNWYHHKFVRMPREYGQIGCVDCGRCIEFCPAKINFKKILKELIKN